MVEALLGDVRTLRRAGMATLDDVLKVELRLSEARLARVEAEHRERVAEAALANLLRLPLDTEIAQADSPGTASQVPPVDVLQRRALSARPELAAVSQRLRAAEQRVEVEDGGKLPSVQLFAGYLVANPHQRYFPVEDEWHGSWQAGVGVSWNAWDWGIVRSRTEAVRAQTRQLEEQERKLHDAVLLQVLQQRLAAVEASERIDIARENVRRAQEHYRTTRVAFAAGTVSSTEILDAQTTLQRARTNLSVALVDHEIAWARLERAVGESLR